VSGSWTILARKSARMSVSWNASLSYHVVVRSISWLTTSRGTKTVDRRVASNTTSPSGTMCSSLLSRHRVRLHRRRRRRLSGLVRRVHTAEIPRGQFPRTGDSIVWWLRRRTDDSVVASSSPGLPQRCRVTTLGKLFTPMCLCHQAV